MLVLVLMLRRRRGVVWMLRMRRVRLLLLKRSLTVLPLLSCIGLLLLLLPCHRRWTGRVRERSTRRRRPWRSWRRCAGVVLLRLVERKRICERGEGRKAVS